MIRTPPPTDFRLRRYNCPPVPTCSLGCFASPSFSCSTFGVEAFPLTRALFILTVCEKMLILSRARAERVTVLVSMDTPAHSQVLWAVAGHNSLTPVRSNM